MRQSLPQCRIAIVQSEKETLHSPQFDLAGLGLERWGLRVEVLTDRDYAEGLHLRNRYDAVVFATNAINQAPRIAAAIRDHGLPDTNCVVLHQNLASSFNDLRLDGITACDLHDVAAFEIGGTRGSGEPLTEWPRPVRPTPGTRFTDTRGASEVRVGLKPTDPERWESAATVHTATGQRWEGLVRSPITAERRLVLCTLPLVAAEADHRAILTNMVAFAAIGVPALVILSSASRPRPLVQRKIRLSGAQPLELELADSDVASFEAWPLSRSRTVLLAPELDRNGGLQGLEAWLRSGGTLMSLRDGDLVVEHGATDQHAIARRWAGWFHATDTASWCGGTLADGTHARGSLFSTRAVLRLLQVISEAELASEGLDLPHPSEFRDRAGRLIAGRRNDRDSIDGTVSTTCAALEIDRLVGGVLDATSRGMIESWLRSAAPQANLEERVDVSRVLEDQAMFQGILTEVRSSARLTPSLLNRVRIAAISLGCAPSEVEDLEVPGEHPDSPLLAASSVLAWSLLCGAGWRPGAASLAELDRALASLDGEARRAIPGEPILEADAECLADTAYAEFVLFGLDDLPTDLLGVSAGRTSDESLLRSASTLRTAFEGASTKAKAADQELRRVNSQLQLAANLLSGLVVMVVVVVLAACAVLIGDVTSSMLAFIVSSAGVLAVLALAWLARYNLAAGWAIGVGRAVSGGFSGIWDWASSSAAKVASRGSVSSGDEAAAEE